MAYTTIDDPTQYFEPLIWTGDASSPRSLTGLEFQPDMVWSKRRDDAAGHNVLDSVRGAGVDSELCPSSTGIAGSNQAETYGYLSAFTSDGFTVTEGSSDNAYWNNNTATYVAWNWKESATAGFDIVSYTGNGTDDTDISHNLSAVPKMIIVKNRDAADAWQVYHAGNTSSPETDYMVLNDSAATADAADRWSDEAPTSSVFTLGDGAEVNTNTENYIAYCFAEKQGFSKFGSYTGNGNADGPFIYTGFRPAWLMVRRTDDANSWIMKDTKRSVFNPVDDHLLANNTGAESTGVIPTDFVSNGFKQKNTDVGLNASGGTYIYMAIAEAPFVNSNGVPCNAR